MKLVLSKGSKDTFSTQQTFKGIKVKQGFFKTMQCAVNGFKHIHIVSFHIGTLFTVLRRYFFYYEGLHKMNNVFKQRAVRTSCGWKSCAEI